MNFRINSDILTAYPELYIGTVTVKGVDNCEENPDITNLLRAVEKEVREKYSGSDVTQLKNIVPWREAYMRFGSKPKDYRCSSEALLRLVLNGRELRHINKLVDIYNYVSLKYVLTVGGEDLAKLSGDLVLSYADGTESFTPLGSDYNDPPQKGEIIYKDNLGVICRRWNWREGDCQDPSFLDSFVKLGKQTRGHL